MAIAVQTHKSGTPSSEKSISRSTKVQYITDLSAVDHATPATYMNASYVTTRFRDPEAMIYALPGTGVASFNCIVEFSIDNGTRWHPYPDSTLDAATRLKFVPYLDGRLMFRVRLTAITLSGTPAPADSKIEVHIQQP